MKISILGDYNWESKIDKILIDVSKSNYKSFFKEMHYGDGLAEIVIVCMCRDSELNFKQRIKFSKKNKMLGIDVMLDFNGIKNLSDEERKKSVIESIINTVSSIVFKYKIKDFNADKFIMDFQRIVNSV